jgi:hypothetical protein
MSFHVQRRDDRGDYMTFVSMQHMPLSSAYLCEDCHCVGNCAEQCPACASSALLSLSGILNREQPLHCEPLMDKVQVSYAHPSHLGQVATSLAA